MSTSVRVFALDTLTAPEVSGNRLSYDSIQLVKFPYLARALLTSDGINPANSAVGAFSNRATKLLFAQVEPGKSVYYELTPEGRDAVNADAGSPILRGDSLLVFGPNWTISILAVAA